MDFSHPEVLSLLGFSLFCVSIFSIVLEIPCEGRVLTALSHALHSSFASKEMEQC